MLQHHIQIFLLSLSVLSTSWFDSLAIQHVFSSYRNLHFQSFYFVSVYLNTLQHMGDFDCKLLEDMLSSLHIKGLLCWSILWIITVALTRRFTLSGCGGKLCDKFSHLAVRMPKACSTTQWARESLQLNIFLSFSSHLSGNVSVNMFQEGKPRLLLGNMVATVICLRLVFYRKLFCMTQFHLVHPGFTLYLQSISLQRF